MDEIVPPVNESGQYALPAGEAFGPDEPAWSYSADPPESFHSTNISGAERQLNGNTLICDGDSGRFFEVKGDGDLVWDYVNPVGRTGVAAQGGSPLGNGVFKVRRYPPDFPGFNGRALEPGDPVELFSRPFPVPGGSLVVTGASPDGADIDLQWDAFGCPSFDYNLIYGDLHQVPTSSPAGAECAIGVSGGYLWTGVPSTDLFFLIVGTDETGVYESSWGTGTDGTERGQTGASFLCGATTKIVTSTCP
jgi:hypothetical protein